MLWQILEGRCVLVAFNRNRTEREFLRHMRINRAPRPKAPGLNLEIPCATTAPLTLKQDILEGNFTKTERLRQHAGQADPSAATGTVM